MPPRIAVLLPLLLPACADPVVRVYADSETEPMLRDFVEYVPGEILVLEQGSAEDARRKDYAIEVFADQDCGDCFELAVDDRRIEVHGGTPLGVQYGLGAALEGLGFGFYHPHDAFVPAVPTKLGDWDEADGLQEPQMSRRGLHLHTLHPTDALFDFWLPSDQGLERAKRVVDWVVKARGNHLQWVGLNDIQGDVEDWEAWREHTAAIVDYGHERGLTMGLGVELYGSANLQQAFDLLDQAGDDEAERAAMDESLALITDGIAWDVINLSFGEFFGEDPDAFIASVDRFYEQVQVAAPGTEVVTWIHIGDDVVVEYDGQEMIYYFLVQFAESDITHSVHTVMYYNLFDDAGGAYHHEEFDQHREFLLGHLEEGQRVNYFPESAYWVAFDINVPVYLPIYVASRWTDMHEIDAAAAAGGYASLDDHVLFSTGWEWGYWQHDWATLRMNWSVPERTLPLFERMLLPYGELGAELALVVDDLAWLQYEALIGQRLAPWYAGREAVMEAGYVFDIVSQPWRPGFDEIVDMSIMDRGELVSEVLTPLYLLAEDTQALRGRLEALELPEGDPWVEEIRDGLEIDVLRASFVADLYTAVLHRVEGSDPQALIDSAETSLVQARGVVARRHAALHDPEPERLLVEGDNPTIYDFGYLLRAEELCFWERELVQARNEALDESAEVPTCAL